jgi:hypothetical protein
MAAWRIKFTEGSKSGKKHPLPIDLSTENKKAKRSAYEKDRRPGRSFNRKLKSLTRKGYNGMPLHVMEQPPKFFALAYRVSDACIYQ